MVTMMRQLKDAISNQGSANCGTLIAHEDELCSNATNEEERASSLLTNEEEIDNYSNNDLESACRNANSNHRSSLSKQARYCDCARRVLSISILPLSSIFSLNMTICQT